MHCLKKILLFTGLIVGIACSAQDSLVYKPLPQSMVKILQDTTLPELFITTNNQVTKNIHRIVDSLYGKSYPFSKERKHYYNGQIIRDITFMLQKGNYIFVIETVTGGDRFGIDYGHLIVFNPTLSDSLPKVVYYGYNDYRLKINKAEDLIDSSVKNNFVRQTLEEYEREN